MRDLMSKLILDFSLETGILDTVNENIDYISGFLLFLAVLSCFFGFHIYRAVFSVMVFVAVILACCFIMKERTDWGTVTATFAVFGTALAFFAYRWHRLGAFLLCGFMGGMTVWNATKSLGMTIGAGALSGALMLMFPVIMLCLMTSLWGTLVIYGYRKGLPVLGEEGMFPFFIIMSAGFVVQMVFNRRQKLFGRKYPKTLEHWIKEGRKAK